MKKQFLLLIFLAVSKLIFAIPDDGIREHDIVIGYNDNYYYSIKTISYPSGTYFSHRDSAFLVDRELQTGKVISKIFLSTRYHRDSTSYGDWKTKESDNNEFNYVEYLKENNIKYLFPNVYRYTTYRNIRFDIDSEGLKIKRKNEKELLLGIEKVEIFAPWVRDYLLKEAKMDKEFPRRKHEYIKVFDTVGDNEFLFVIIEGKYDPEYLQSIVVIRKDKLEANILNIIN